jgi:hypothetical protein
MRARGIRGLSGHRITEVMRVTDPTTAAAA